MGGGRGRREWGEQGDYTRSACVWGGGKEDCLSNPMNMREC